MNRIIYLLICLSFASLLEAQSLYVGIGGGQAIYNGDLSHHPTFYSSKESNSSISFIAGYDFNESWKLNFSFLSTKLEGSDVYANNDALKLRNLSFYSNIKEFSVNSQFHFLKTLNVSSKYISPYLEAGMGVFYFNPKTMYEGVEYELQRMNTEGQGLPNNNTSPYQLIDINLQLGAGIAFNIGSHFRISMGSVLRILRTDYLDDVSGSYYDINKLAIYKGEMAANLAYRGSELSNDLPESLEGVVRGNNSKNDSYLIHQLSMIYIFGK